MIEFTLVKESDFNSESEDESLGLFGRKKKKRKKKQQTDKYYQRSGELAANLTQNEAKYQAKLQEIQRQLEAKRAERDEAKALYEASLIHE